MGTMNPTNGPSVLHRVISSYESSIVSVTVIVFVRQRLAPLFHSQSCRVTSVLSSRQ
jgi:hypothetical protein